MSIYNSNTSKINNSGENNNSNSNSNKPDVINQKNLIDETAVNDDANKQRLDCSASKPASRFNMQDYEFKDVLGT
jgi:hypothetical protein